LKAVITVGVENKRISFLSFRLGKVWTSGHALTLIHATDLGDSSSLTTFQAGYARSARLEFLFGLSPFKVIAIVSLEFHSKAVGSCWDCEAASMDKTLISGNDLKKRYLLGQREVWASMVFRLKLIEVSSSPWSVALEAARLLCSI